MDCSKCKWPLPETCKVCKQDEKQDQEKKPADDYGIYYLTKISKN